MKLFFCVIYFLIVVIALSGCGSKTGNSSQDFSTRMMGNKAQITVDQTTVQKNQATIPPDYGNINNSINEEQGSNPENVPSKVESSEAEPLEAGHSEADSPKTDLLQRSSHLDPIGTVARNVRLGKEIIGGMSATELKSKLSGIASKTNIEVKDAYLNDKTWSVAKGKNGRALNIEGTVKTALSAKKSEQVKILYDDVKPEVTETQLKAKIKTLARFTTRLLDRSKSRVYNIRLAAKKLDCTIVMPGEEFSFNKTTGSKSKKMGYKDATTIIKTPKGPEHKKAPGGGVCQLSTTIYNAVLKCGFKVTERHEHSDDVHYVPKGKDATVVYSGADLKFVNNRSNPIMIRAYVGKKTVTITILEREE